MRVGIVTPRYPPTAVGGGEISIQLFAENIQANERVDELTVLSLDGHRTEAVDGVTVRRLGKPDTTFTEWQNIASYRLLRDELDAFDVVHAYNMELNPVVGFITDRQDIPSVASFNSYHFFKQSMNNASQSVPEQLYERVSYPTTGRLMRGQMKRIDAFLAASEAVRRIYDERGFSDSQIEVIPIIMDPAFDPVEVDTEAVDEDTCSLLYVGRLVRDKGVEHLVRAVAKLPASYTLRVVGDGPLDEELQSLARTLGVDDRIEFTGRVEYERVKEFYAQADVFVHPGVWPEPLNRTLLEAMQAGLTVVCTDIGGPPEVIPDDEYLCEPGDPSGLADVIERAREGGAEVGQRNREHVYDNYAPGAVVPQIVDLYEDVITG